MKNNHYPTFIALAFFAGTFLIVFTTEESSVAALRFVTYLIASGLIAVSFSYKEEIMAYFHQKPTAQLDNILSNAESFSKEYGDVYVMADHLKRVRKNNKKAAAVKK